MTLLTSALAATLTMAAPGGQSVPAWEELEQRQVTIDRVDIVIHDVFDLSRPSERHWIGRLSNAVHIDTDEQVIRRELLFAPGLPVNARAIRETERNLRRYDFVRDARIVPVAVSDTAVAVRVEVFDAWSLQGHLGLSRSGGNSEWTVRIDEVNLFGRGKRLFVEHERDLERSATGFGYTDPQLFGSRWVFSAGYSDLSDGSTRFVAAERPYFSVETPYGAGLVAGTSERLLTQYNDGEAVTITPVRSATMTVFASRAFHVRNQRAIRAGVAFRSDEHEYGSFVAVREGLPAPDTSRRRTRGFLATLVVLEERPVTFQNFRRIGRTEDYNAGWTIAAAAGYFAEALDGTAGAPYGEVAIQKGLIAGSNGLLVMDASAGGRHERDGWRNASGRAALTAYAGRRGQTIAAQVALASSTRPDVADWLYLGGRDGLRGYVDHFLAGDRRITLSLEDRIITSWRPLGLVQAGFVAYLDAGAIRRADTGRWSRLYANIGGGLRFGASKSGGNLIQISIATPLVREPDIDRLLLVLGNAVSF